MAIRNGTVTRDVPSRQADLPGGGGLARHGLVVLAGLALVGLAVALLLACLGYDPGDPSWNTATGEPVRNLLWHLFTLGERFWSTICGN